MGPIKLYWPHPDVAFNGRGISEGWLDEMLKLGFEQTAEWTDADCAVFISDSQIEAKCFGQIPTLGYFWGWPPARWLADPRFENWAWRQAQLLKECDQVLVPSPCTMDQLAMLGVRTRLLVPGVDAALLDKAPANVPKKNQVLFLSRLASHKGLEQLIEAMSLLRPQLPLVVSGPGDHTPYQDLATRLGVETSFHQFSDPEKLVALKESAVLVHPSHHEGFGLPPLEAYYLGTPAIVRFTPHMVWLLRGSGGFFDNTNNLAQAIAHVLEQRPEVIGEVTGIVQKMVREEFTLARAARDLAQEVHEAIRHFCGVQMRAHPENAEAIYDRDHRRNWFFRAQNFDPTWERHFRAQHFISELRAASAEDILDCGSGGIYPTIFARAGFQVTAYDHSEECLRQVAEVAKNWGVAKYVAPRQGKAETLPFEDNSFSSAVLGEILEHVQDPGKVLAEAVRVVKPGGVVVCSSPVGHAHFDPLHLGPAEGGWDEQSLDQLLAPYEGQVVTRKKIAEQGTEPSCYLFTIRKAGQEFIINASAKASATPGGVV